MTIELTRETAQSVVQAYDFSGIKTVVDVGGGYGEMLAYVLKANPGVSGTLFDLPYATEGASQNFRQNHAELYARYSFISGDFFESVPPGADIYILKSVIHDWNAEKSIRILTNCRRAMTEHSRLLIIEPIMPEGSVEASIQEMLWRHDLTMLAAHGAGAEQDGIRRSRRGRRTSHYADRAGRPDLTYHCMRSGWVCVSGIFAAQLTARRSISRT